jgi:hypothetical protein
MTDLKIGHYRVDTHLGGYGFRRFGCAFVLLNLNPALSERAATGDLRFRLLL